MNILKKWSGLGGLLIFCMCHQPLQPTHFTSYQLVSHGQYPTTIHHQLKSNHAKTYFKIIDDQQAKSYPAQRWNDSTLIFLVEQPDFKMSESIHIEESNRPFVEEQIQIKKNTDQLTVFKNDQPVLTYQIAQTLPKGKAEYYQRSGFIHPLYSPKGKILTDDFPEGHTHQHGVFFAFVNTTFQGEPLDFWNQHHETGTIQFSKLIYEESGPVFGKFETVQDHISLKHGVILKEKWVVTVYQTVPYRIDIQTILQNVTTDTLYVNDYKYGGMSFRGAKQWNEEDSLHFQNEAAFHTNESNDRNAANHTRPLWAALSGAIDGAETGVALLGHPSNFRYPEPVRIHPKMPYYCLAPMVGKKFSIAPKGFFAGTYTFFTYDGAIPNDFWDGMVKTLE